MNKIYTSIEQSKQLAEILPHESADMFYLKIPNSSSIGYNYSDLPYFASLGMKDNLPAWSLTALLDFLKPNVTLEHNEDHGWKVESYYVIDKPDSILQPIKAINGFSEDEPIDACVNMILKLNEENLI